MNPASTETLATEINNSRPGEKPITAKLATSGRVLRRVTDGIYREPWSALRELVSNAYDADSTDVTIDTDAPRFSHISIRDNGIGFSAEALASMINHIGGSTKRRVEGSELGITSETDPTRSPSGRKLIGKLGIGLFAVSQLTHEFQVITKQKGDKTRTIADVLLFQYADTAHLPDDDTREFETGSVKIWKVPAKDKDSQGTEIILRKLLPHTKAELTSEKLWTLVDSPENKNDPEGTETWVKPEFHIGRIDPNRNGEFLEEPNVPWDGIDPPEERFRKLTQSVFRRGSTTKKSSEKPSLENSFDNYLRFIWKLSLAAPIDYMDGHPFDLDQMAEPTIYQLSNEKDGRAKELQLGPKDTIRRMMKLVDPDRGSALAFTVKMDGVALKRPLKFKGLPSSDSSIKKPMLFVGHCRPDLSKYDEKIRGGDLEFEAYLMWAPRILPTEHNGVMLRVHDASGTLFDKTFMDYRVSEQTRTRQVSAEVFIHEGLDAALNLDRESFNVSHPHYQYIARWVHNAFKQFATVHKSVGQKVRVESRVVGHQANKTALSTKVAEIVGEYTDGEPPLHIEFSSKAAKTTHDQIEYALEEVFKAYPSAQRKGAKKKVQFNLDVEVMRGVAQILHATGLFENLNHAKRQRVLRELSEVIFFGRNS
jgi:hypothetical protein